MNKNSSNVRASDSGSVFKTKEGRQLILDQYYKILAEFDFEYKEQYVDTSYGSTYIIESGAQDLPPLLLFHGSSGNDGTCTEKYRACHL